MPEQQKTAPAPRSISGSSQLLFDAAEDPDICFGSFACGLRVAPRARLPILPAVFAPKQRWRLPQRADPLDYAEDKAQEERKQLA